MQITPGLGQRSFQKIASKDSLRIVKKIVYKEIDLVLSTLFLSLSSSAEITTGYEVKQMSAGLTIPLLH